MYLLAAIAVYALGHHRVLTRLASWVSAWICYAIARSRDAVWYTPATPCPGCGDFRHLMRFSQDAVDAGMAGAYLCLRCAGQPPKNVAARKDRVPPNEGETP